MKMVGGCTHGVCGRVSQMCLMDIEMSKEWEYGVGMRSIRRNGWQVWIWKMNLNGERW